MRTDDNGVIASYRRAQCRLAWSVKPWRGGLMGLRADLCDESHGWMKGGWRCLTT